MNVNLDEYGSGAKICSGERRPGTSEKIEEQKEGAGGKQ